MFKLKQNGVNGNLLQWFTDYITDRKQKVLIGSAKYRTATVNAGGPQGSVLGPLLFLIFVNDIPENLLSIARLFADDKSLSFSSKDLPDIEGIINHDLRIISAWAKQWLVDFNPAKTSLRPSEESG